jgi:UDP-N-acetylmuramoylalanine--D-glutamate ligase
MDLNGKRILVVGLGKTGVATVRFLTEKGAVVSASDEKPASELVDAMSALGDLNVNMQVGEHRLDIMSQTDMVVPSPGVPPFNVMLLEAAKRGIPILSEIELAWRFLKRPMIAITGTNGKTTTTALLGEMLKKAGKEVFVGGNIGNPLIGYVNGKQEGDYVVVEVSSFQLQWVELFKPLISILLNTTHDHLDYHGTFKEYYSIKERIFKNQNGDDLAILNADDPLSPSLSKKIRAEITCFSSSKKLTGGIFLNDEVLRFGDEIYPREMIKLPGVHNIENIMAALVAARRCGCHPSTIISAVDEFKGIPHRIEYVGQKNETEFYDDSKATNVGAVVRALETFTGPVILLLGGRNKGGDFSVLSGPITEKVKQLVLFGEAGEEINSIIGGTVPTKRVLTLADAVRFACDCSFFGDVVLLSPGCASFDEFANYKERGRYFKKLIRAL